MMPFLDPDRLDEAGWGVVFPARGNPDVRYALEPLLELRARQAAHQSERSFRVFSGDAGYRRGETMSAFLSRLGVPPPPAEGMPYYLLIVGSPQEIPYAFQQQLDVRYAVGRIHFESPTSDPRLDSYRAYAKAVVESETSPPVERPPAVAVFAPTFPDDPYTAHLSESLVRPLIGSLQDLEGCEVHTALGDAATKHRLLALLAQRDAPPLLFAATHAVLAAEGDPVGRFVHAAPLCAGWPGPDCGQGIDSGSMLTAEDLREADSHGPKSRAAVLWSSFSAGARVAAVKHRSSSPHDATVSLLAQEMLGHVGSGTLAVIGLVDRLWSQSFAASDTCTREALLRMLSGFLRGDRVGHAAQACAEMYAQASSDLADALEKLRAGYEPEFAELRELGALWAATQDLSNLVLLGDPAVRLSSGTPRPESEYS